MSRKTIYFPHSAWIFAVLLFLLVAAFGLIFIGVIGVAFSSVGFSPLIIIVLLIATLLGSAINIPVTKLKTTVPIIRDEYVNWFGVTYRIPQVEYGEAITTVAVNVGGALIPTAISIYLLTQATPPVIIYSIVGVVVVALITKAIARPVRGVGIMTPAFIPPVTAAILAFLLSPGAPLTVAYVSGVLGTLIGADLLNLRAIPHLGAPVASIGGAGTFDGVFLSGIIAVLLAGL
jgi:uncharacterized membrane protein